MHCGYQRHLGLCLGYVPALAYGSCRVSDQGTTLRASDIHNAQATILNPFNNISSGYSFVPSGNYPLPVPVLTKISRHHVVSFSHNELTIPTCPPHLSDDHRRPGRLHEPRVGSASLSHSYVMVGRGALPQWHGRSHVNWRHSGICWAWVGSQSWSLCRHSM